MKKPFATYKEFRGENSVSEDKTALKKGELQEVYDIDIDIDKSASNKQQGTTLLISGAYDNLWGNDDFCFCTQNGNLYQVNDDFSTLTLLRENVGDNPMSYCDVAGTGIVYYSNLHVIGYIRNGTSYVMASTTERDRVDTFPMYPIEYFGGRLWGFVGDVLWMTDPDPLFYFNRINLESNFIQRKAPGTLLKAVHDGLYVAAGSHWFIRNAGRSADSVEFICDYDAIPGTETQNPVDIEVINEDGSMTSGKGHLWWTEKGLRYGLSGGLSGNITRKRINMPSGVYRGASLHRDDNEAYNRLITSLRT